MVPSDITKGIHQGGNFQVSSVSVASGPCFEVHGVFGDKDLCSTSWGATKDTNNSL